MKTVFSNPQLAHIWAQQTQESGHSGSMSFDRQTIYSYATPIARIYNVPGTSAILEIPFTTKVVLVSSETFSMTTSGKHMPAVNRAVSHMMSFSVPHVMTHTPQGYDGTRDHTGRGVGVGTHADNHKYLAQKPSDYAMRMRRMRSVTDGDYRRLFELGREADRYARVFGLDVQLVHTEQLEQATRAYRAAADAKRDTPAYRAKQARKAELAALEAAKVRAAQLVRITEWKAGIGQYVSHIATPAGGAYLRVNGDVVQTSLGASVPVNEARTMLGAISNFLPLAKARNGFSLARGPMVGAFTLNRIEADGSVRIGCHFIEASELAAIAAQLGV